jgi:hypothetical protein
MRLSPYEQDGEPGEWGPRGEFIARLSPAGEATSLERLRFARALDVSRDGRIVMASDFAEAIDLGNGCAVTPSTVVGTSVDAYVSSFGTDGRCEWIVHLHSEPDGITGPFTRHDIVHDVVVDPTGAVIFAATFDSRIDIAATTLEGPHHDGIYVAKLLVD